MRCLALTGSVLLAACSGATMTGAPAPDGPITIDASTAGGDAAGPDAAPGADAPGSADAAPPDAPAPTMLTVTVAKDATGSGSGQVTAADVGFACGADCSSKSFAVSSGAAVTLLARPELGSTFQGWTGACAGVQRSCTVTVKSDVTATARFVPIDHNLVFATSEKGDGYFGGLAAGDAMCSRLATAANLAGTYRAYLSTSSVNAVSRLTVPGTSTPARGFVRLDGKPIFDAIDDVAIGRVWYPIHYDENGNALATGDDAAWTGTQPNGHSSGAVCNDWQKPATGSAYATYGEASAGPPLWVASNSGGCGAGEDNYFGPYRLTCFMVDKTTAVAAPTPVIGKRIWVSKNAWVPAGGRAAADAVCAADKPGTVANAAALLSTTDRAAADLLDPAATYVRPGDGVAVGTGADLIAVSRSAATLEVGPWTTADGSYTTSNYFFFSGVPPGGNATTKGTADSTCDDWTATTNKGSGGIWSRTNALFWRQYTGPCNEAYGYHLLCVEM
jgi:uncharacterized repeat protein (TIGR02543 family)